MSSLSPLYTSYLLLKLGIKLRINIINSKREHDRNKSFPYYDLVGSLALQIETELEIFP